MALTTKLTEAHWKKNGLPKRSLLEKIKNPKTGISEALRALATAEEAFTSDMFNLDLRHKTSKALESLRIALTKLQAGDKELAKLKDEMKKAIEAYRAQHKKLLQAISHENIEKFSKVLKSFEKNLPPDQALWYEAYKATPRDYLKQSPDLQNIIFQMGKTAALFSKSGSQQLIKDYEENKSLIVRCNMNIRKLEKFITNTEEELRVREAALQKAFLDMKQKGAKYLKTKKGHLTLG